MRSVDGRRLPVAIIGAGPVGLAAAARLVEEQESFVVLEAGPHAGDAVLRWRHVRLFTPWRYLVDEAAVRILERTGWSMPSGDGVPTGGELVSGYVAPLADTPEIAPHVRLDCRVTAITREGRDKQRSDERATAPFVIHVEGPNGEERLRARAVIDASGTYLSPNPIGAAGLPALGEGAVAERVFYGIPDVRGGDRSRYEGMRVAVVGSGHSAINALLELSTLRANEGSVDWVVRSTNTARLWGGGATDELPERGALGSRIRALVDAGGVHMASGFATERIEQRSDGIVLVSESGVEVGPVDEVIVATGFRPDLAMTRELRLDLDAAVEAPADLAPFIDPNVHSCGSVPPHGYRELSHPEEDFYTVGMKSYGRAPTFLLLTGYEQVRSVVKALAGDLDAAGRVELTLPETGVCGTGVGEPKVTEAEVATLVAVGAETTGDGGSCCAPTCCGG